MVFRNLQIKIVIGSDRFKLLTQIKAKKELFLRIIQSTPISGNYSF